MEILFLSSAYKPIHHLVIRGICECLEKNKYKVSNEYNPAVKYDCILVFNRKILEQHKEILQTVKIPVIYLFCLSDIVKEYCVSDLVSQTFVFKDKILNLQHLSSASFVYMDMMFYYDDIQTQSVNNKKSVGLEKLSVIYINIEDEYFGNLIFLKILPYLNLLHDYKIYYQTKKVIEKRLINKHIRLMKHQQNVDEWLDKSAIVIGSGLVAYRAVLRGKKTIVIGEKGYGGLVTEDNLEYHLANFFQGRNGGKFDEYIPLQLLQNAIETEAPDVQKILERLSVLQIQNEKKLISSIEKMADFTRMIYLDGVNLNYILNPNYDITKKKSRRWLSQRTFNKLFIPVNESETAVILTFREPRILSEALDAFPAEYEETIREYIQELISKKILIPFKPIPANAIISWGFIPNNDEQTPKPSAVDLKLLNKNNGIFVGDTRNKNIYFTFDLGSESGYTNDILNILKDNNIKAIFFLAGSYLAEKVLINRMITEGHLIGNHTDKHKDLPTLSEKEIKKDILTFQNNFRNQYPHCEIKFFRPPFGRFDHRVLKIATEEGLRTVLWSVASADWEKDTMDITLNLEKVTKFHPGAIILLHIRNSGALELLKKLLLRMTEKGYRAGDPSELLY